MEKITLKNLQDNFESIMEEVSNGKYYLINHENQNFVLMPYTKYEEIDDLIRIHTTHSDAS